MKSTLRFRTRGLVLAFHRIDVHTSCERPTSCDTIFRYDFRSTQGYEKLLHPIRQPAIPVTLCRLHDKTWTMYEPFC